MSGRVSPAPATGSPLWMTTERVQIHTWTLTVEDVALILPPTRPKRYMDIRGVPPCTPTRGASPSGLPIWEVRVG